MRRSHFIAGAWLIAALLMSVSGLSAQHYKFSAGQVPGFITVDTSTVYSESKGFGWLDNAVFGMLKSGSSLTPNNLQKKYIQGVFKREGIDNAATGEHAAYIYPTFVVDLPPGFYDVRLIIGRTIPNAAGARIEGKNAVPFFIGSLPDNSSQPLASQIITGRRFTDTVTRTAVWDGQLTIELTGSSPMISAIEITPVQRAGAGERPAVHLVGDSTVASHGDNMNEVGWGVTLPDYFAAGIEFNNAAVTGASARSFITEGGWNNLLLNTKPGDFVLISLGNSDSNKSRVNHFASPDEFKSVLKQYVNAARVFNVTPVFITPVNQNTFNAQGRVFSSFEDWNDKIRELAREENLFLVDLARISQENLQQMGPSRAGSLYKDTTNLSRDGAARAGRNIATAISGSSIQLARYAFSDVDRDDLRIALAAARVKNKELYTPQSYSALQSAVAQVEAMPVNMNQSGVDSAARQINSAVAALVRVPAQKYSYPPRQMEYLDRGLYALKTSEGVFLSWRYLGTDDPSVTFNLYRNGSRITTTQQTNYVDRSGNDSSVYTVSAVINGAEVRDDRQVNVLSNGYLRIPLSRPQGGINASGPFKYFPNDASVGDVNGDGRYEIFVKWDPDNAKDNSQSGHTGHQIIDCYTLEGRLLWRIDLGPNIRSGAHYTQFMVYDLDGDGRAELVCRTSDGTIDGTGKVIGHPSKRHANDAGHILEAPEYLTVFDGLTGAMMDTVPYDPPYNAYSWGDTYGNRGFRFLSCIAYLDGVNPSVITARGYYTHQFIVAYRYINKKLVKGARFDSTRYRGPFRVDNTGNHSIAVLDADFDGKDEIIYGAMSLDHNLNVKWSTGHGHGDAQHQGDLDPLRPGLEIFGIHEGRGIPLGSTYVDANTGEVIWGRHYPTGDIGRGLAADLDPRYPGSECYTSDPTPAGVFNTLAALYTGQGIPITEAIGGPRPGANFAVWWDGDLEREILDHQSYTPTIFKWNWKENKIDITLRMTGTQTCNGTKATPMLQADILGDWREEVLVWEEDANGMRLYMTSIPTEHRLYTLMHNPQYRNGIAWQNVAYNQPPNVNYFLGHGMDMPPQPNIFTAPAPGKDDKNSMPLRSVNPVMFILGDNTAQTYSVSAQTYDPDGRQAQAAGWGQVINRFFKPAILFRNYAAAGANSRSFISDGRFDSILGDMHPGDYLLIQFGHNDSSAADYKTNMQRYINGAKERGAIPVIITPVSRMDFNGNNMNASFSAYVEAAKELASETMTALIDLNQMSREFFEKAGSIRAAREFYMTDGTNFRLKGAIEVARLLSEGMVKQFPALAPLAGNENAQLDVPAVPSNFRVVSASDGQARIAWSGNPSDSFAVYFRDSNQSEGRFRAEQSGNSYTFDNLENGKDYFVKVRAFNSIGTSDFTSELKMEVRAAKPGVNENFNNRFVEDLPWQTQGGTTLASSRNGSLTQEIAEAPGPGRGSALRIYGGARNAPRGLQLNLEREVSGSIVEIAFDWFPGRPSENFAQLSIQDGQSSNFRGDEPVLDNQFITFMANRADDRLYIYMGNKNDNSGVRPASRADIQPSRILDGWVQIKVVLDFTKSTLSYELRNPIGRVLLAESDIPFAAGINYNRKVGSLRFVSINAVSWSTWIDNLYIGELRGN